MRSNRWLIVAVAAVLALFATVAHAATPRVLPIDSGEFVRLHVGSPGTTFVFWLRWDMDELVLFPSAELERYSRSYDHAQHTEKLCFDNLCFRMRMYVASLPSPTQPAGMLYMPRAVSNYQGVLGLAAGSQVWQHFSHYLFTQRELVLSTSALHLRNAEQTVDERYVAVELNGQPHWAQINMESDYSFLPFELTEEAASAPIGVRLQSSGGRFRINSRRTLATTADGLRSNTFKPISLFMDEANRTAIVQTLDAARKRSEPSDDLIVLGHYMLAAGFAVSGSMLTGSVSIASTWVFAPSVLTENFWLFYVLFGVLLMFWLFGVLDSLDVNSRAAVVDRTTQPMPAEPDGNSYAAIGDRVAMLSDEDYYAPATPSLLRLMLPPSIRAILWGSFSVISIRNREFMRALVFASRLIVAVFIVTLIFGFGYLQPFFYYNFSTQDRASLYMLLVLVFIYGALLEGAHVFGSTACMAGENGALCGLWLVAAIERTTPSSSIIMLITSGWAASNAIQGFVHTTYVRSYPLAHYRRRRWVWRVLHLVHMLFWIYFFPYYTIVGAANGWLPQSASSLYAIATLGLVLVIYHAARSVGAQFWEQMRTRYQVIGYTLRAADRSKTIKTA